MEVEFWHGPLTIYEYTRLICKTRGQHLHVGLGIICILMKDGDRVALRSLDIPHPRTVKPLHKQRAGWAICIVYIEGERNLNPITGG